MSTDLVAFHQYIGRQLENGATLTPAEALTEFQAYQEELERLRAIIREAEQSSARGATGPFDAEETKSSIRERLVQIGIAE